MNLVELLYDAVVKFSSKSALKYKKDGAYRDISYGDLWENAQQFAAGLLTIGVTSGDKVGILSANCPEWVIGDYGLLSVGAVSVPIYPTIPPGQVEFILRNADVTLVIVQNQQQLDKVLQVWPEQLRGVIAMEPIQPPKGHPSWTFEEIIGLGRDSTHRPPDFHNIPENTLASIVHTSGTSGTPKGVMLSHRNLTSNILASVLVLPIAESDVSLSYLPLSHIFERTVEEYAMLSMGATVAYAESVETIQDNLREIHPTILVTVPRLLEKVYGGIQVKLEHAPAVLRSVVKKGLQSNRRDGFLFWLADRIVYRKLRDGLGGRLRAVVSGGAGLAKDIAEFYTKAGIPVYEGYGMTESSPVIAANPYGHSRAGTVGRPLPGVEVRLAEDGELQARGSNVMMGYYNDPEETAKAITPDGWLCTGDIAEIESDGYIRIVDRKKNILVLATGKNVAPWPIENAITLSPYIAEAVLVGDERQYITCLVVPDMSALAGPARQWGLTEQATWLADQRIRALIAQEIAKASAGFAPFERPKRASLLGTALSMETGELTPTLKVRTKLILQKYGDKVEAMYEGTDYLEIAGGTRPVSLTPDETATHHG